MNDLLLRKAKGRFVQAFKDYQSDRLFLNPPEDPSCLLAIENKYSRQYEQYQPNQLYGKGILTRLLYGIDDHSLPCAIPHGITLAPSVWSRDILSGLPIVCCSDYQELCYLKAAETLGVKIDTIAASHPVKLLQNKMAPAGRVHNKKIVYFHGHSSFSLDARFSKRVAYISELVSKLRIQYTRVSLCIYYIDYIKCLQAGAWPIIQDLFDEVYCCGSRYDPSFLIRLVAILGRHSYLATDSLGSHVFYALIAGVSLHLLPYSRDEYCYSDSMSSQRVDNNVRMSAKAYIKNLHDRLLALDSKTLPFHLYRYINVSSTAELGISQPAFMAAMHDIRKKASHTILAPEATDRIYKLIWASSWNP